jgi:RNA polymerase primary sigma factor
LNTTASTSAADNAFAEADTFGTLEHEGEHGPVHEENASAFAHNPHADDALSQYLKEMGSIPMLKPRQERELTQRLAQLRTRYRHAILWNWSVIAQAVATFENIAAGELILDRTVDTVPSQGLTADRIRERLPQSLSRLRNLLADMADYRQSFASGDEQGQRHQRRANWAQLREAVRLVEELSPRTELLNQWGVELQRQAAQVNELVRQEGPQSEALRALLAEAQMTPKELARLVRVQKQRRARYLQGRRELAQANLRLVVSIAKRYRNKGLPFADLIQEGNSGLMRAVDKYDHGLGFRFGTYATWWIRQGVTRALADLGRTVRIPCHQMTTLAAIEEKRGELTVRHGREPAEEEVAAAVGISREDLRVLSAVGRAPASLSEGFGNDQEQAWVDVLSDTSADSPAETAHHHLLQERIAEVLRALPPRDREVLELRFGLRDGQARTLDEVAQIFGVTRERVRQIEIRGLLKLRQPERRDLLAEFAGVA